MSGVCKLPSVNRNESENEHFGNTLPLIDRSDRTMCQFKWRTQDWWLSTSIPYNTEGSRIAFTLFSLASFNWINKCILLSSCCTSKRHIFLPIEFNLHFQFQFAQQSRTMRLHIAHNLCECNIHVPYVYCFASPIIKCISTTVRYIWQSINIMRLWCRNLFLINLSDFNGVL